MVAADSSRSRRERAVKPNAEIVLICNPKAGGRWKELASILDSDEARYVRRIVTDSVEDIALALDALGHEAKLLCIYGGDGTIQRVIDRIEPTGDETIQLALLGGGTMNVTSRWCGFSTNPGRNFRYVVNAYRSGQLLTRELPLLNVRCGDSLYRGFTFGMGPIVRLLDAYERSPKGKVRAVAKVASAATAAWFKWPPNTSELLRLMKGHVKLDGEAVPYEEFATVFANVTGQINPGVEPFVASRTRDSFYCAAYSVSAREFTLILPMLARGWLPKSLDLSGWIKERTPTISNDPRYVNRTASRLEVRSDEEIYTVDGEILPTNGNPIQVDIGPMIKLVAGPLAGWRMAAESVTRR